MKKTHFLMVLLTLFGCSSPANAVEATVMHEDLEARVSDWVVDHETSTITNNEELRQGRNFTEDQLTTIFKDLRDYLTAPDRYATKLLFPTCGMTLCAQSYVRTMVRRSGRSYVRTIKGSFLSERCPLVC